MYMYIHERQSVPNVLGPKTRPLFSAAGGFLECVWSVEKTHDVNPADHLVRLHFVFHTEYSP